jgi:hypothetical protein
MRSFDKTRLCTFVGYWTNLYSGIVFDGADGGNGSMPRDVYDDNPDYLKRSALHGEVIPLFRQLEELAQKEHQLAKLGIHPMDPKVVTVRKLRDRLLVNLMHVHRLTLGGH